MTTTPPYNPTGDSAAYTYADVAAVAGGLSDLDLGDGGTLAGVPCHGPAPAVGDRVMVLQQGRGAVIVPAPRYRSIVHTATTNSNGFIQITAAQFGLSALDGAHADVHWSLAGGAAHWASTRRGSPTVAQVLIWSSSALTGGTVSTLKSTQVTVRATAWGTPVPVLRRTR